MKIKTFNTVYEFMPYFQMIEYRKQYNYFYKELNKAIFNKDSDWNIKFYSNNANFFYFESKRLKQIIYN